MSTKPIYRHVTKLTDVDIDLIDDEDAYFMTSDIFNADTWTLIDLLPPEIINNFNPDRFDHYDIKVIIEFREHKYGN